MLVFAILMSRSTSSTCLARRTSTSLMRRLRDTSSTFATASCVAIACPACMTLELARSCAPYVTTIVNNCDIVPTISPGEIPMLQGR